MEIQDTSAAIYSEAKSEYTKQLVFNFQPTLLRFFLDRHAEAKGAQSVISKTKSVLSEFQESLTQIPEWNLDKVQRETATLLQTVHCDYIEDLITAVFIAHTKILSAIRLNAKPRQKIRITVPKPDHFMHRTLSECSRLLWSNIYLFSDSVSSLDRQKNMNDVNRLLEEGILQAIRNLLPVKSILRDSLQEDEDDIQIQTEELKAKDEDMAMPEPAADMTVPDVTTPDVTTSDMTVPDVPTPDMTVPHVVPEPLQPIVVSQSEILDSETPSSTATPTESVPVDSTKGLHLTPDAFPRKAVSVEKQNTLVVETEKTVGFTGIDSVFGTTGDAELRATVDEASDEFKILGDLESLDMDEFEDIHSEVTPTPLSSEDYESI